MRYLITLSFFILSVISVNAQTAGVDYKIYSSATRQEIGVKEIAENTKSGEVLIFGEQHDDSIGHLMEFNILKELHEKLGSNLILSMEMFHRDVQYILDEYLQDLISEKNFIKESRAWETYKTDYKPCVEFAKQNKLTVVAANTPSRYTNMVTRKGLGSLNSLSKNVRKSYLPPLPVDTLTGKYFDNFMEVMGGHSVPGMNLYQSQNIWDATMAWSIAQAMKQQKNAVVFMLVGRFHSDYHLGTTHRLEQDYKKKVKNISCFSADDFAQPDWEKYASQGDYIIVTRKQEKVEPK